MEGKGFLGRGSYFHSRRKDTSRCTAPPSRFRLSPPRTNRSAGQVVHFASLRMCSFLCCRTNTRVWVCSGQSTLLCIDSSSRLGWRCLSSYPGRWPEATVCSRRRFGRLSKSLARARQWFLHLNRSETKELRWRFSVEGEWMPLAHRRARVSISMVASQKRKVLVVLLLINVNSDYSDEELSKTFHSLNTCPLTCRSFFCETSAVEMSVFSQYKLHGSEVHTRHGAECKHKNNLMLPLAGLYQDQTTGLFMLFTTVTVSD